MGFRVWGWGRGVIQGLGFRIESLRLAIFSHFLKSRKPAAFGLSARKKIKMEERAKKNKNSVRARGRDPSGRGRDPIFIFFARSRGGDALGVHSSPQQTFSH